MPMQNCSVHPTAKLRVGEGAQIDDRLGRREHAPEEGDGRETADPGADRDRRVLHPLMLRSFLQHVFQRAEEARHEQQAPPVEAVEQFEMRLVEIDQRQHTQCNADAGHDVDEEQPVPRHQVGDVAADRRPDGRGQRRDEPDDGADDVEFRARENRVGRGEHGRDHAGAEKALQRTPEDHLLDRRGEAAKQACGGEARRRDREQEPRAEGARQESRQRDRDHLGDQIGGLNPGHLAGARRQPGLDFAQGGRDDLDVQDRHEHPEHHDDEREQPLRRNALRSGIRHHGR
ncbi:hypothetical protein ABH994_001799 [Bradyrhizobium yuanmingense]